MAVGAAMGAPGEVIYTLEPQTRQEIHWRGLVSVSRINETADDGNVVIVSHAASYALANRENVLRVLVTASARSRGSSTRRRELVLTRSRRQSRSGTNDAGRSGLPQDGSTGIADELPTHYDLVINTDRIHAEISGPKLVVNAAAL